MARKRTESNRTINNNHLLFPPERIIRLLQGIKGAISLAEARNVSFETLHRPARQARDLSQLSREQPELEELIIDGTERRLPRPQDPWSKVINSHLGSVQRTITLTSHC